MIVTAAGGLEHWKSKQKVQNHDNTNTSIATNEGEEDKVKEVKDKETKSKKKNTVSETVRADCSLNICNIWLLIDLRDATCSNRLCFEKSSLGCLLCVFSGCMMCVLTLWYCRCR